jgi:polysaccharide export outer membrane protein
VLPILDKLDVIDEPAAKVPGLSVVQPGDLIPLVQEYVIGPSDTVTVSIYELLQPGQDALEERTVDELGKIRLPVVGVIDAAGKTPSGLERHLVEVLETKDILKNATVSAVVTTNRQNTFSVIGEPRLSGTEIGTYNIPKSDFRLLDAMALARGVSGGIKKVFVIRQIPSSASMQEVVDTPTSQQEAPVVAPPSDPTQLIEDLLQGIDAPPASPDTTPGTSQPPSQGKAPAPSMALSESLESGSSRAPQWVNVNGQWVKVEQPNAVPADQTGSAGQGVDEGGSLMVTQRIIEVPYDKLLDGDMRYNIVIRPGDVINVPPPVSGNVYVGGAISRPGTYSLPGDRDLTLKQLVFAAGNVSQLAIPERVDLIRRMGDDQEAIVRMNMRAIFEGTQPDFYLKANDTVNIGTSFTASPLAIIRNGLRLSYGFGFLLDRNFGTDVFGPISTNNQ